MRDVISVAAVGLLVCASCSSGSTATPTTDTVPPYSAEPLPTAEPVPTVTTVTPTTTPTTAIQTTQPPPTAGPASSAPDVSIAGEVTSPEQQAVVDAAVRGWRIYRKGIQNPSDPALEGELEGVYIDDGLSGMRAFFKEMSDKGQYVEPDLDHPAVFVPILSSLVFEDDTATLRFCHVISGALFMPGPTGDPMMVNDEFGIGISVYELRRVENNWRIYRLTQDTITDGKDTCSGES